MKKWLPLVILGCLIVALGITRWLISRNSSIHEVEIFEVRTAEFVFQVESYGKITSRKMINLRSRSNGIVRKLPASVQVGIKVTEGAFLCEVNPGEEEARTSREELKKARTELEISRRKYELYGQLFKLKAISENELIREKLNYETQNIKIRDLKERLTSRQILAPFSGIISEVKIKNGTILKKENELFTICDMEQLISELEVNEKDISMVRKGQEVKLMGEAFRGILTGEVERVSMVAKNDERTSRGSPTFLVTVSIENPGNTVLRIGGSVLGKIVLRRKANTLSVPLEAVLYTEESTPYLFVYEDDRASRREVKTGFADSDMVEIVEGLKPGEKVITRGSMYLKNNARVKIGKRKIPYHEGL